MTLNSSGPLDLAGNTAGQSIAHELGRPNTPTDFNQPDVRALAGIPSGPISLTDFYGKSAGGGSTGFVIPLVNREWANETDWSHNGGGSFVTCLTWVNILTDGRIQCLKGNAPVGPANVHVYDDNYYTPTTAGIGTGIFVKAQLVAGTVPNAGSSPLNTWIDLSSTAASWSNNSTAHAADADVIKNMTILVSFSTSASDVDIFTSGTYAMHADAVGNA